MGPAKDIYRPEAAALAAPFSWDADLAQPATKRDASLRIGGNEVDRSLAFLVGHGCLGPSLEFGQFNHCLQSCHLSSHIGFGAVCVNDV